MIFLAPRREEGGGKEGRRAFAENNICSGLGRTDEGAREKDDDDEPNF